MRLRGSLLLVLIQFVWGGVGLVAYLSLSGSGVGAYSRWALIRGWALIRINTVVNEYQEAQETQHGSLRDSGSHARLLTVLALKDHLLSSSC